MSVVNELLRTEADNTLSFGNFELEQKSKLADYEYQGDVYKVKTFKEITKLERNGVFVYESVPGTAVTHFQETDDRMQFQVEGMDDAQITVEAENGAEYKVNIDGINVGRVTANLGGKLVLSVELNPGKVVQVELVKQ
ncbi:MAG: endosialidase [Lachnospiraceae bacterium]|nr:endosialidase [Lachnospiraceae bacterium]